MEFTNPQEPIMNLYQITHFDYFAGKRIISGYISGTDVNAAKQGFWKELGDAGCLGALISRKNDLHIIGGNCYTFTKIAQVA